MRKSSAIIIVAVLLAVAAVAGFAAMGADNKNDEGQQQSTTSTTTKTENHSSTQTSQSATTVSTNEVEIENYTFTPGNIKVKVGDTVTWTNKDSVQHNVMADKESGDAPNGPLLSKGESYSFTFKKAGTYAYHCGPHPYMKATVTVE